MKMAEIVLIKSNRREQRIFFRDLINKMSKHGGKELSRKYCFCLLLNLKLTEAIKIE